MTSLIEVVYIAVTGVKGEVEKVLSPINADALWRTICGVRTKRRR